MSWLTRRPSSDTFTPPRGADGVRAGGERFVSALSAIGQADSLAEVKFQIYEQLLRELDLDKVQALQGSALRRAVEDAASSMIQARDIPLGRVDRQRLIHEVADEIVGLGPLEPLLADVTVTEIMVNGPAKVYVERGGLLTLSDVTFRDNSHLMRIIERIISPLGRRVDEASPMVDARLPDGSRVNAIIPPLALDGPGLTIRKFARDPLTVDDLLRFGTLTSAVATFLEACVRARISMIVSGGTGTGKTTMLNVLSSFIPPNERILTIEDPAELQLRQPHVFRMETRPANVEGRGEVSQRQLVRNALRMRPDRIIVGEVRGGEAFDMLQAMNTGHDGSLTTVHANTPRDSLSRIESMVLQADLELPISAIRDQIASGIGLILQLSRLSDGSRRVTHVSEVIGLDKQGAFVLNDLFLFYQSAESTDHKVVGEIRPTGIVPRTLEKLAKSGAKMAEDLFTVSGGTPPSMASRAEIASGASPVATKVAAARQTTPRRGRKRIHRVTVSRG
jgi:pilus assembly protein CpaF